MYFLNKCWIIWAAFALIELVVSFVSNIQCHISSSLIAFKLADILFYLYSSYSLVIPKFATFEGSTDATERVIVWVNLLEEDEFNQIGSVIFDRDIRCDDDHRFQSFDCVE